MLTELIVCLTLSRQGQTKAVVILRSCTRFRQRRLARTQLFVFLLSPNTLLAAIVVFYHVGKLSCTRSEGPLPALTAKMYVPQHLSVGHPSHRLLRSAPMTVLRHITAETFCAMPLSLMVNGILLYFVTALFAA
jgi:hypothetical protein